MLIQVIFVGKSRESSRKLKSTKSLRITTCHSSDRPTHLGGIFAARCVSARLLPSAPERFPGGTLTQGAGCLRPIPEDTSRFEFSRQLSVESGAHDHAAG